MVGSKGKEDYLGILYWYKLSPEKYSVTTDAVVRAVTVTFRLGEKVEESTVGSYHVDKCPDML